MSEKLGIDQRIENGRRFTDAETLKIVTMVYAGHINKTIVARLQSYDCNAIGLSGPDANMIRAHKRINVSDDFGFVGDIDEVNYKLLHSLLQQDITPVINPITHDGQGQLLNTNADTIAQEIAKAMGGLYAVSLVYCFEKNGVLSNVNDDNSVISKIDKAVYEKLKEQNTISAGMLPKIDNAFTALEKGVTRVTIGNAENLPYLLKGISGTIIQ